MIKVTLEPVQQIGETPSELRDYSTLTTLY